MLIKKVESDIEMYRVTSYILELQKSHSDRYPNLFRYYGDHEYYAKLSKDLDTLEDHERLSDGRDTFLYFEEGENIIGCALVQDKIRKNEFASIDSTQLFVTCFIIDEAYRNKGIGKSCFRLLQEWAKAKGYKRMELSVSHDNISAISLYECVGLEKEMLYMSCEI